MGLGLLVTGFRAWVDLQSLAFRAYRNVQATKTDRFRMLLKGQGDRLHSFKSGLRVGRLGF